MSQEWRVTEEQRRVLDIVTQRLCLTSLPGPGEATAAAEARDAVVAIGRQPLTPITLETLSAARASGALSALMDLSDRLDEAQGTSEAAAWTTVRMELLAAIDRARKAEALTTRFSVELAVEVRPDGEVRVTGARL